MDKIETQVFCEDLNNTLTLNLTREELDRASIDTLYLRDLINKHLVEVTNDQETVDDATAMESISNETENSLFLWNTQCVLLLLNIYEDHMVDFKNGSKRHKNIWEEIAIKMKREDEKYDVTGLQCKSKLNGLKRTYKKIIDHNKTSGNDRASWPFFQRMHEIFGVTGWAQPISLASSDPAVPSSSQSPKSQIESPKQKKKDHLQDYLKEIKEERRQRLKEKENQRKEREEKKNARFTKFVEMKERQHKEKMKLIERLINKQ